MRSNTLAILGLIATAQALPARDKRQFELGEGTVDFSAGGNADSPFLVAPGFALPPNIKLPPGITIPRKRVPQGSPGGNKGGHHGGKKGDGNWGKPDDPIETPVDPPQTSTVPEYPEEPEVTQLPGHQYPPEPTQPAEPEYPEYPDDEYPEHEVTILDIIEAQQKLAIMNELIATLDDPIQKAAIQRAIERTEAFLLEYVGVVDPSELPDLPIIFAPGGRHRRTATSESQKLYDTFLELVSSKHKPSFAVYMVAEQLLQILLQQGYEIDPTLLGIWAKTTFTPKAKRQDGIFALPGSCDVEDIIGLETTLATLLIIYGRNPPSPIASLRNAVTAALLFCKTSEEPIAGGLIPEVPEEGGALVPEVPEEGGALVPEVPEEGGALVPEVPEEGGALVPEVPEEGGELVPEVPTEGGELDPEEPIEVDLTPEEPIESELTPETPIESELTPETPIESELTPEEPIEVDLTPNLPGEGTPVVPILPKRRSTITPNLPIEGSPIVPNIPGKGSPVLVFPTRRSVPPVAGEIVVDVPEAGGSIVPAQPVVSPDLSTGDEEDSTIVVETPEEGSIDADETEDGSIVVEKPVYNP